MELPTQDRGRATSPPNNFLEKRRLRDHPCLKWNPPTPWLTEIIIKGNLTKAVEIFQAAFDYINEKVTPEVNSDDGKEEEVVMNDVQPKGILILQYLYFCVTTTTKRSTCINITTNPKASTKHEELQDMLHPIEST